MWPAPSQVEFNNDLYQVNGKHFQLEAKTRNINNDNINNKIIIIFLTLGSKNNNNNNYYYYYN